MIALDQARRNLKRIRTALLQAAVTGRLVSQDDSEGTADDLLARAGAARTERLRASGQRRIGEPLAFASRDLPTVPANWSWASLDSIADIVGGMTKDAKKQRTDGLIQVPYLRVANVQRGYLDLTQVTTIGVTQDQLDTLRLFPGDILFNEGGDRDKLGRGWVWDGQLDPCIHQNHVFRARLYSNVVDPRFVSWHGNSFGQRWFVAGGKQTTNLASVSKTTLRSFPVPIPPKGEQERIIRAVEEHLALIDHLAELLTTADARSESLRASILSAAFSGKLVSQDPSDEPASVLLERIATDRASANGHKPVRTPRQERLSL